MSDERVPFMLLRKHEFTKLVHHIERKFVSVEILRVHLIHDVRPRILLRFQIVKHILRCARFAAQTPVLKKTLA